MGGSSAARWLVTTAVLIAVVFCAGAPAASAAGTPLPAVHSVRGTDPRIADASGAEVLLRGVDEDALGDYYQQYAKYPAVLPLSEDDYREMAGLGFNVVRLIISWSSLEPTPGSFNLAYVARIRQAVDWGAENGIYTVLDMHQDAWGIGVAGPPGGTCPPGTSEAVPFDGAPEWATMTDGMTPCAADGVREISLADEAAWQNFYDNTDGIQTQLVSTWAKLAAQFAADPAVAGYDLLNEPNPGLSFAESTGDLGDYYSSALDAIRAAEASTPGGFSHIAFFEPGAEWSLLGTTVVPTGAFTSDPNIVFAPHLYGGSLAETSVDQGFQFAQSAAGAYDSTVWGGEYGWYGTPSANLADITDFARQQDAHIWGGAWWQWKQACGSPSTVGSYGGAVPTVTPSLVRITCAPGPVAVGPLPSTSALAIPVSTEKVIGRATVHVAPGVIDSLTSTPATSAFSMTGTAPAGAACELTAWVPGTGRPRFTSTNLTALKAVRVRGGYDVSGCATGNYTLALAGRDAPGLSCARALEVLRSSVGANRRTVVIALRERRTGESACAGRLALGSRRARFSLTPGSRRRLVIRLRQRFSGRYVRGSLAGVDVDADHFSRRVRLTPRAR